MFELQKEKLADPRDFKFIVDPIYYHEGIADSPDLLVREGVLKRLSIARERLPEGWNFKLWDGYRTLTTQTILYTGLFKKITQRQPLWDAKKVQKEVEKFIYRPSFDLDKPSPHNTGAAIDLTLIDENREEIDMGTPFDHFEETSYTMHFERAKEGSKEYKWHHNRMILYSVLIGEGFFNFPDEWWHFSYGDLFWAKEYGEKALYGSHELSGSF